MTQAERCARYRQHTGHISICFKENELNMIEKIEKKALGAGVSKAEYCKRLLATGLAAEEKLF